jgi:3-deoxy-D-manno-octulosonic-acid transferase
MIEPAAYGVPVLFGPHVWNFRASAASMSAKRSGWRRRDCWSRTEQEG